MPYNLLLLPLLAGFVIISKVHLYRYYTSQLQKEQLLLAASLAGLATLVVSRVGCVAIAHAPTGEYLVALVHGVSNFHYVGTALGTIVIAFIVRWIFNYLVPENLAGFWLYNSGAFNQLESMLLQSVIGLPPTIKKMGAARLLQTQALRKIKVFSAALRRSNWRSAGIWYATTRALDSSAHWTKQNRLFPASNPKPVMLTMKDGKVYVGFVSELPPVKSDGLQFVRILPLWSGYRDSETKVVSKTTSYERNIERSTDPTAFLKVIPVCEISSANLYDPDAFEISDYSVSILPEQASEDKAS